MNKYYMEKKIKPINSQIWLKKVERVVNVDCLDTNFKATIKRSILSFLHKDTN